jgi:hypothetical protein
MKENNSKSERINIKEAIFNRKILNFKEMLNQHKNILKKMREMI